MKKTILVALSLTSILLASEGGMPGGGQGQNFEQHKQQIIQRLEMVKSRISEQEACVNAASSREALKACHEKMKMEREEMKNEMRSQGDNFQERKPMNQQEGIFRNQKNQPMQ